MADQTDPPGQPASPKQRSQIDRGRALIFALIVLVAGLTGAFVAQAISQEHGFGPGPWHGSWHGAGIMGGPLDPASIEEYADRAIRQLAIEIDATAEHQDKLRGIVTAAVKDMLPILEQARAGRVQANDLLTQATIDRVELEKLRSLQIALWDAASKRITQALGDAAEVLTREQRQKIGHLLPQSKG
jgi:periplasmic protein CpxP/Spy